MDLKDSVLVLCSAGNGISKEMVSADWKDQYNMKHHSLHSSIEQLWTEKSKNSIRLFNASKFRLHDLKIDDRSHKIKFFLGTTSYKEFIGTNCAPFANKLVCDGITDHSNSQSYLADPVGVGGLLETSNNDLIFMRRSSICAEMPELIDRPGGHPEPDEVASKYGANKHSFSSTEVVDELFNSVLREIRDEINIPLQKLASPLLLGISYNPKTWKRPSLEFYTRCYLSTKEVLTLYAEQTQAESEESTDLVVIPVSRILDFENFKKNEIFNEFTHPAKSAVYCLQTFYSQL